jgi:hypothetical protein
VVAVARDGLLARDAQRLFVAAAALEVASEHGFIGAEVTAVKEGVELGPSSVAHGGSGWAAV